MSLIEMLRCRRGLFTGKPPASTQKAMLGGEVAGTFERTRRGTREGGVRKKPAASQALGELG